MRHLLAKSEWHTNMMNVNEFPWLYATEAPQKGTIRLSGDGVRHLAVLRLKPREKVSIFDGKGKITVCEVLSEQEVNVLEVHEMPKNEHSLTMAVAVPKGERADWLMEKLGELGVSTIIPLKTEHSVVLPRETKQERWQNILIEACKQSKNPWMPELRQLSTINEALKEPAELRLLLDGAGKPLKQALENLPNKTIAFIGPEGGFTDEEKQVLEKSGCISVSLGNNVLRMETAAMAVATAHKFFK
jgi:16S rRNA (uracil1498-N3)-methyltransferase